MPDAIKAKTMDDGPTRGMTFIFISCAKPTISEPGSAMAGHPASDNNPMDVPSKQGFKNVCRSPSVVYLFNTLSFNFG